MAFTATRFGALLLAITTLFGCGAAEPAVHDAPPQAAAVVIPAAPPPPPFLIHLPGISGELSVDRSMVRGLRAGGYDGDLQIFDWSCKDPGLNALYAHARNLKEAQRLADLIVEKMKKHPDQKITLTGHSGGAGVAVWALEKLPTDVYVADLFLLAPALSPGYDLSPALQHVRGKAYAFTSQNDVVVLGIGTRLFETIDGLKVEAAGKVGFDTPDDAKFPKAYAKLVPMPYEDGWLEYDNMGDHVGVLAERFSANFLAPLVTGHAPPATQPKRAPFDRATRDQPDAVKNTDR